GASLSAARFGFASIFGLAGFFGAGFSSVFSSVFAAGSGSDFGFDDFRVGFSGFFGFSTFFPSFFGGLGLIGGPINSVVDEASS
ncbi:hypothetical protein R0K19_26065, partial [Bacillus sp. SIMBA_161]